MGDVVGTRPFMPGYGILETDDGLLPWSWAEHRLRTSRNYWVATRRPDGRPHLMPVWATWSDGALWFASSVRSRKVRNLRENPAVSVATEDGDEPVVLEGTVTIETDRALILRFLDELNAKYGTTYGEDFLDPADNATMRVRPARAFGTVEAEFLETTTKWELP